METGVAEIPTAFVARYVVGTGKPVMGILGEFDALATLSQKAGCTVKDPVQNGGSGHVVIAVWEPARWRQHWR